MNSCNALLIVFCIVIEAFVNSNDIIRYSYILYFVRKVVFHSFFIKILMRLNASFKLNFINHFVFRNRFFISFNKGNEYLFFIINVFIFL